MTFAPKPVDSRERPVLLGPSTFAFSPSGVGAFYVDVVVPSSALLPPQRDAEAYAESEQW